MANDWKAERCAPSALIRVEGTNFFNMRSAGDLQAAEAAAPAYHRQVLNALKASGKHRDEFPEGHQKETVVVKKPKLTFGVGATAKDMKEGRRVTVIKASVGYTKKSNMPVHRVADSDGNVWLAKESDLKLIY